jgi:iron complex outermembrane receptor protein
MNYQDQLVLTGRINDVGAYTRTNIPKSYRAGIELQSRYQFCSWMNVAANIAISRNIVKNFTEYIDDYDMGGQKINNYHSTAIALSPGVVGGATVNLIPAERLALSLISKYVSKQFLDNTQNNSRKLDGFYVQDFRIIYTIKKKMPKEISLTVLVNNIFDNKYEPSGYTYNYIYGGELSVNNYYFPMAGIHFMMGVNIKL